ncbi:BCCT family transporter [Candidatus Izimaplasma bacterium ZiA1]|uniref:BCCT family transporter n=1 Tax=Candidatus Izimoplasma sp. ZiA1 TaxID=2024899 RepID=UPI0014396871
MSIVSAVLVFGFIFLAVVFPEVTTSSFNIAKTWVTTKFNLWFVIVVNVVFVSIIILAISKYGKVTIGYKGDKPNFSRFSWYAMLFSAGIGIGIFFYGIAEPIFNLNIPDGLDTSSYSPLTTMYLHWGFHPWAVYSLVAIAIGYFSFNKGLPVTIRSLFYPILKDRIYGIYGDIIDTVAVLSVLFGLSTSLGLGARQINAGFNSVFNLPISDSVQVILIVVITFIATLSVVSGISKGIRILSEINIKLSSLLFLFILIIGPTTIIFQDYFFAFYRYLIDIFKIGSFVGNTESDIVWQSGMTIFYWAWWFSWSPFVGLFIARISRGRTIREIVFGVTIIPTLVITFVMTILGSTGLYLNTTYDGIMTSAINNDLATSLFVMINNITSNEILIFILSIMSLVAIIIFFVTSSDSGSLVVDNLTSGGKLNSPKTQRVFWACMEGLIAASVLVLGGSNALTTLQTIIIITGLPFSIMIMLILISLIMQLRKDNKEVKI